ncbi:exonuclease SbcCD subunit D [Kushneria aurantia]|uniref:Nuclease SbcCD subunit D n=1 Tax=Kushneria aurantia TaxID=504092 RepID=A0ABV6FYL0_9GAMM|nr:exonuclease SbcCD subunit D C-terminal domain-containing protein [Kushneria aurantia]
MKLIHTADWHLGQSFHGRERHFEQRRFLDWLLDTLSARRPDALLIAGDIFDVVNPSLAAQQLLYDFLVSAHERLPQLDIVMIAGNHDSGARIELPAPLLARLNVHALGRLHYRHDRQPDCDRLAIPLTDAAGEVQAWCLALPFVRPSELGARDEDSANPYLTGASRLHEALLDAGLRRRSPGQALIAMSHVHLRGASVSANSERPIVIGGEESLPASLFPASFAYVALGHLHRPQRVGEERLRYSGSPLALDFSEAGYHHQVLEVTLDGEHLVGVDSLPVPAPLALERLGPAPLEETLKALAYLPAADGDSPPREAWPWLEVRVRLDSPCVDLRARIERALADRAVRLVSLSARLQRSEEGPTAATTRETPAPGELFAHSWRQRFDEAPPQSAMDDLNTLLQEIEDSEHD